MSVLQIRFWAFDFSRLRDNAFWQFEQFFVVQKSPILANAPFTKRNIIMLELEKIFIFANKHNYYNARYYCWIAIYLKYSFFCHFYIAFQSSGDTLEIPSAEVRHLVAVYYKAISKIILCKFFEVYYA